MWSNHEDLLDYHQDVIHSDNLEKYQGHTQTQLFRPTLTYIQ